MKHKYKLSSGLWEIREQPEFETDQEAWEYLRLKLKGKWATLYRWTISQVPVNNADERIPQFNDKYKLQQIQDDMFKDYGTWEPVLFGATDDVYNVNYCGEFL